MRDPTRTRELAQRIGAGRCIIAGDVGTLLEPTQLEALRLMVRPLLVLGIRAEEINLMLRDNPARLPALEPTQA